MLRFLLLSALAAQATAWSRFNVGDMTPTRTSGGGDFSLEGDRIHIMNTVRGENPDIPVSPIARYPLMTPTFEFCSKVHAYHAAIVLTVVYFNLVMPKGTDPRPFYKNLHKTSGKIISYTLWIYYPICYVLNCVAIAMPVEEWEHSPPLSDWRLQVSYIVPFGVTTTIASIIAFALNKWKAFPQYMAKPMIAVCWVSIVWWFTIGCYQGFSQMFGGQGDFGTGQYPGNKAFDGPNLFFRDFNILVPAIGTFQAFMDYTNVKLLTVIAKTGNSEVPWLDQHVWGIAVFAYQACVIFCLFLAYFPFCMWFDSEEERLKEDYVGGFTCVRSPFYGVPVFLIPFFLPYVPIIPRVWKILKKIYGIRGETAYGSDVKQMAELGQVDS